MERHYPQKQPTEAITGPRKSPAPRQTSPPSPSPTTATQVGLSGWNGTILKTTDGGDNWTPKITGTSANLTSVTFANDGNTGWAVGWNGTILKTTDGGDNWTPKITGTSANLTSVTFANDRNTGWAVGWNGTILKTTDGGDNWTPKTTGTSFTTLLSVTFANDRNTGWAVGWNGTILKTTDGGDNWTPKTGTSSLLASVTFSNDGNTGWAVGWNGTILKTTDGGDNWTPKTSGTSSLLASVTFSNDGNTGWAVGDRGTILLTDRRGESWRPLNADNGYRKYPAPWTWIAFVLAALMLHAASRPVQQTWQVAGVAEEFASDRPITGNDPDPLQRRAIADTLSRFLRNENTEPPLTIAITGDWGEGKSSLMNLTAADLAKYGTKTVWFNAWHHQKEQHLFAALLQAVRDQAIPALLSIRSLPFRWHLLLSRFRRHWSWGIITILIFGFWFGALVTDDLHPCRTLVRLHASFFKPICPKGYLNGAIEITDVMYLVVNLLPVLVAVCSLSWGDSDNETMEG